MIQAFQLAARQWYQRLKPTKDAAYRQWVKRFPCVACGSCKLVDPCHTGPHGLGQKASDHLCLPMCRVCHEKFDADPQGFALNRGLDIAGLIEFQQHLWYLKTGKQVRWDEERKAAA